MAESKRYLKVTLMRRRKEGMSEEDFDKYWSEKHAPLVSDWLAKHGVLKYTQYHTPQSLHQKAEHLFANSPSSPSSAYDGTIELLVPSLDVLAAAHQDPYYRDVIQPDEQSLYEKDMNWTVGWEEVYVLNGRAVKMPEGDAKVKRIDDSHHIESRTGDEGLGAEYHEDRH